MHIACPIYIIEHPIYIYYYCFSYLHIVPPIYTYIAFPNFIHNICMHVNRRCYNNVNIYRRSYTLGIYHRWLANFNSSIEYYSYMVPEVSAIIIGTLKSTLVGMLIIGSLRYKRSCKKKIMLLYTTQDKAPSSFKFAAYSYYTTEHPTIL